MEVCVECQTELNPETDACVCYNGRYTCAACEEDAFGTPNTNYLYDMRCPQCGAYEPFRINISMTVLMFDAGAEDDPMGGDQEWNQYSYCECDTCQHYGNVKDFRRAK